MQPTEPTEPTRNYNTISPSAKSLMLMKGLTDIPFAKQAAALMQAHDKYNPASMIKDMGFLIRILHFESRYWSIGQLLTGIDCKNILELSSGYSFRGLDMVRQNNVHYIDTDLPDVIALKQSFVNELQEEAGTLKGNLELLPLNALDENQFDAVVNCFAPGPVVIVNEGLLMYLNESEKEKLCTIIHKILKQRGGYWITADIYTKLKDDQLANLRLRFRDEEKKFFEQHNIEQNKFDSFEAAEGFFKRMGFVVEKEAVTDHTKLSSLKHIMQLATPEQLQKMQQAGKIQATWRLTLSS